MANPGCNNTIYPLSSSKRGGSDDEQANDNSSVNEQANDNSSVKFNGDLRASSDFDGLMRLEAGGEMHIEGEDENYSDMEDRLNYLESCMIEIEESQTQLSKSLNYLKSGIMKELQRIGAGCSGGGGGCLVEGEPRRKVSRKSPKIGEADTEMSSNLQDKCRCGKQTPGRAHGRKPTHQAGRPWIYSQRRAQARRKAGGTLEATKGERFDNCKTVSTVIHDFLMNMTLPMEQVVVRIKGEVATRKHILSMLRYVRIEAEILNCYAALLTERARRNAGTASYRVWYLPSWTGEMVTNNKLNFDELYAFYLTEDKFGGIISECEKICIPLNWDGNHWYLAVVYLKTNKVLIFDSLPDKRFDELRLLIAKAVCSKISGALYAGCGERFTYNFNKFEYSSSGWCPKQINKWDSGMFVMKFMELCDEMEEGEVHGIELILHESMVSRAIELFIDVSNEARQSCMDEFEGLREIVLP